MPTNETPNTPPKDSRHESSVKNRQLYNDAMIKQGFESLKGVEGKDRTSPVIVRHIVSHYGEADLVYAVLVREGATIDTVRDALSAGPVTKEEFNRLTPGEWHLARVIRQPNQAPNKIEISPKSIFDRKLLSNL